MKKLLYPFALTLTAFLIIYSCSAEEVTTPPPSIIQTPEPEPPAPTQYTLEVTAGEGGSVSTEGGTYDEGTEVTITATPVEGYEFVGWEGSDSTEASLTVTLGANTSLNALFEAVVQYTLNINSDEGGSVSIESGLFTDGAELTIVATADDGYEFLGWYGSGQDDIFGYDTTLSLTINGNEEINARFYIKMPSYERYSAINETTSQFYKQKYFYRYLTAEETRLNRWVAAKDGFQTENGIFQFVQPQTFIGESYPQYRAWSVGDTFGDFDKDGKLDYFGAGNRFTSGMAFGSEKTQYLFISNYFQKNLSVAKIIESKYVNWNTSTSIGDFDNDGYLDIWMGQNNRHNNAVNYDSTFSADNAGQNIEPGRNTVIYFSENGEITEEPVGPYMESHHSNMGDIDNDGDIDFVMFPQGVADEIVPTPKLVINLGGRNYETINLLEDDGNFKAQNNNQWMAFSWGIFDLDGDNNLDIFGGYEIKPSASFSNNEPYESTSELGFHNNNEMWVLWGTDDLQYNSSNIQFIDKSFYADLGYFILGTGFTDFDNDGDIDLIALLTITEENFNYQNYEIALFENRGNREYIDVTKEKIEGYSNTDRSKFGDFYSVVMIDKDGDGDFDIVPYSNGDAAYSFTENERFISNLYWENTGGQFVRRELD